MSSQTPVIRRGQLAGRVIEPRRLGQSLLRTGQRTFVSGTRSGTGWAPRAAVLDASTSPADVEAP